MEQQYNPIIFDNTADQYVKDEDVTAFFTIPNDIKDISSEDQIGLLRVGCTNIKKCIAYAPVKFNTSGLMRHGTAKFSSSSLSVNDDEFYQFCYINKNGKNLGTSIPFQLNCSYDDIDLLSNTYGESSRTNSLVDYDDIVVIHPIESQKEQTYTVPHKALPSERDDDRLRSQLATTIQFAKDQATQIVDLERRLMQANEIARKSQEQQLVLEQRLRDMNLTSEKYQRSLEGQLNQANQRQLELEQQLRDSTLTSEKRQRSLEGQLNQSNQREACLTQQLRDLTLTAEKYQRSVQGQLTQSNQREICLEQRLRDFTLATEKHQRSMQGQLGAIQNNSSEINVDQQAYVNLKYSLNAIEKRCVKYQKNELELKRELNAYQNLHNDLQNEVRYLTTRLSITTEDYNTLSRKYKELESKIHNMATPQSSPTNVETVRRSSFYWQSPQYSKSD